MSLTRTKSKQKVKQTRTPITWKEIKRQKVLLFWAGVMTVSYTHLQDRGRILIISAKMLRGSIPVFSSMMTGNAITVVQMCIRDRNRRAESNIVTAYLQNIEVSYSHLYQEMQQAVYDLSLIHIYRRKQIGSD